MRDRLSRARALALLAAAPALAMPRVALAQNGSAIRIGAAPVESYAEPYYAVNTGLYAKAGLPGVEIVPFTTGGQITVATAGGALEVGMADPIQVALAIGRGIPFAIFAAGAQYVSDAPTSRLCVAKTSTIRSAKDLEGGTIGVGGLRSVQELANREWLEKNGVDSSTVKFVELPNSAMSAALQRGTVSAAILVEPGLSAAANDVRSLAASYDAIAKTFAINTFFATREWLAKNGDTARKFAQTTYDTARWANGHHEETVPLLAAYAKLDPDRIRTMTRAAYATSLDAASIQPVLDAAFKYKLLDKPVNAADMIVRL